LLTIPAFVAELKTSLNITFSSEVSSFKFVFPLTLVIKLSIFFSSSPNPNSEANF
jgi:hypothetical protein